MRIILLALFLASCGGSGSDSKGTEPVGQDHIQKEQTK